MRVVIGKIPSLVVAIWLLFVAIPLDTVAEGHFVMMLAHSGRRDDHGHEPSSFLYRRKRAWIAGLAQPSHSAQLGDPCTEPGDCKVPNSECVQTDNLYWNRQNFCVCNPGFHPSTGFCVADSGTDSDMRKLEPSHQQTNGGASGATAAVGDGFVSPTPTPSYVEDTTRDSSVRSLLLMTPASQQQNNNPLPGFHFGNRTQSIVSTLVEQLKQLRGEQQTDQMKERLETMGMPSLLQPTREDSSSSPSSSNLDQTTTVAGGEPNNVETVSTSYSSIQTAATIGSSPQSPPAPPIPLEAGPPPAANFNPFAIKPLPPMMPAIPRVYSSSQHQHMSTVTPAGAAVMTTVAPTMATVVTPRPAGSNSDTGNNSPFLPPALPPFFGKNSHMKSSSTSTTTTTTTTMMPVNDTSMEPATSASAAGGGNPADDPEARLALMKKVQNLIAKPSQLTQRPAVVESDPTTPMSLLAQYTMPPVAVISRLTPTVASAAASASPIPNTVGTETPGPQAPDVPPPQPPPSIPHSPSGHKPHHPGHQPPGNPAAMKNMLNSLGAGKMPPFPLDNPSKSLVSQPGFQSAIAAATPESESQQQVRSTLVDHLPNVDFYAVFRSAAENVIREYLGGMLTTTASVSGGASGQGGAAPPAIPFDLNPAGMIDGSIEKLFEKMVESKTGPAAVLLQVNNHPHQRHHIHGASLAPNLPEMPKLPATLPPPPLPPPSVALSNKATVGQASAAVGSTPPTSAVVTRRHPLVWRGTSPGSHPAHPLPRIVFTGR